MQMDSQPAQSFEFTRCICLHTSNLCISFIFNKFKFLNKGDECALKALLVIIRKARFCSFIRGYSVLWEAAPQVDMQYWIWLCIIA